MGIFSGSKSTEQDLNVLESVEILRLIKNDVGVRKTLKALIKEEVNSLYKKEIDDLKYKISELNNTKNLDIISNINNKKIQLVSQIEEIELKIDMEIGRSIRLGKDVCKETVDNLELEKEKLNNKLKLINPILEILGDTYKQ